MEYYAYSCEESFIKTIQVASDSEILIEYEDKDFEVVKAVYLKKYDMKGNNIKLIGNDIEWDEEEPNNFRVLNN